MKRVYVLAQAGFADWEPAHALAELRRHGKFEVRVVGLTRDHVRSMGGLSIQPDITVGGRVGQRSFARVECHLLVRRRDPS
jgi:putative intracellular protease/amidase